MSKNHLVEFEVPKLDIRDVIKKSAGIYRSGFKSFITLSFISFIFNIFNNLIDYFGKLFSSNTTVQLLSIPITLIFLLVSIYLSIRVDISIYILAANHAKGRELSARGAFGESEGLFWRYIGICLLIGLMIILPAAGIMLAYKLMQSWILKLLTIALLLIPTIYLTVNYGFAPTSAVLNREKHRYFEESKQIVRGDFGRILFLVVITGLIFMVPYQIYTRVLFDYNEMGQLHKFVASSVNQLFSVFTTPFSSIVTVVMFLDLKRNKRIG